jgi:hypothetical protein
VKFDLPTPSLNKNAIKPKTANPLGNFVRKALKFSNMLKMYLIKLFQNAWQCVLKINEVSRIEKCEKND